MAPVFFGWFMSILIKPVRILRYVHISLIALFELKEPIRMHITLVVQQKLWRFFFYFAPVNPHRAWSSNSSSAAKCIILHKVLGKLRGIFLYRMCIFNVIMHSFFCMVFMRKECLKWKKKLKHIGHDRMGSTSRTLSLSPYLFFSLLLSLSLWSFCQQFPIKIIELLGWWHKQAERLLQISCLNLFDIE